MIWEYSDELILFWPALSFTPREFLVLTKPCLHPCDLASKTPLSLSVLLASTLNPTANYNGSFPGPGSPLGPFWFITIIKPSSLTISTPSPHQSVPLNAIVPPSTEVFSNLSNLSCPFPLHQMTSPCTSQKIVKGSHTKHFPASSTTLKRSMQNHLQIPLPFCLYFFLLLFCPLKKKLASSLQD